MAGPNLPQQYHYQQQQQQHGVFHDSLAGSRDQFADFTCNTNTQQEQPNVVESPRTRRDVTNELVEELYRATWIRRPGERDVLRTGGRKNKNEILGLTLARLVKHRHLNGTQYMRDLELVRGAPNNSHNGEFVIVLRTDGRIVALSDDIEQHLGKSMRSLYTQCINIFECLDRTDGETLRSILNSSVDSPRQEYRMVCTFRLPKGKRPSRAREDVKTITMAGHFYSCHDQSSSSTNSERLFIARCEALLSTTTTTNRSTSSQTSLTNTTNNSTLKLTLKEDMSIETISTNAKDILGYARNEMLGNWFGRYLTTEDMSKFESLREKYFHQEQQSPTNVCQVFDMYTNYGEGRLTFLCQIRPIRERRAKAIKFTIVAQLVDPLLRTQYMKYIQSTGESNPAKSAKAEQVNLVPSVSETSEDPILADSPTPTNMAELIVVDNFSSTDCALAQQYSPINGPLSSFVAPVNAHDEFWRELFDSDYKCSTASTNVDVHYWIDKPLDNSPGTGYTLAQQYSPINGPLSSSLAPVNIDGEFWRELFDGDSSNCSTAATTNADVHYWPDKSFDDFLREYQSEEDMNNVLQEYLNGC